MDTHSQLSALLDLAEQIGLTVRALPAMGESDHPGGALVRLRGREILFLDSTASLADRLDVTVRALAGRAELENRFLPPELRERLDAPPQEQP